MLRYHVRSRDLINLVTEVEEKKLIMSPYFQRNLVWREVHKRDFVETILLGLPFPQIFIAQGEIDVETMRSQACIVDGQQRMNAITEYVRGNLSVQGKKFSDLPPEAREDFLRYQVPVIDLEIKASDSQIIDIFQRLNRTFYALSAIEKMSTEFATVDLMLIAKFACGLLEIDPGNQEDDEDPLGTYPLQPPEFIDWARGKKVDSFQALVLKKDIFTAQELARVVHLMYTLNLLSTIASGFFTRNDRTREFLEAGDSNFAKRDELVSRLDRASKFILSLEIPSDSMWWNKSNSFSLMVICAWHIFELEDRNPLDVAEKLVEFSQNLPDEYALSAREGVNNRKQRIDRHKAISRILELPDGERPINEFN
ncbi:DUF262 domain-containing protein [Phaeobacter sp. LSS9]|uniref:DUF262 domain-containing protein n=1 Tax=unclassified Phaeobacter TaxID=2621772 RepID=UPI000E46DD11|nr:DUF262 domain-containing protein [Phaeobacter sp. LSS9]AXT34477.1 DUF262 domain-containing protein [Phaeobacter sp. LSS9]